MGKGFLIKLKQIFTLYHFIELFKIGKMSRKETGCSRDYLKRALCSPIAVAIYRGTLVCFTWMCLHHAAVHLYYHWCTPSTLLGFILSPIVVMSPQCIALRWTINNAASQLTVIAGFIAGYLSNNLEKMWGNSPSAN